MYLFPVLLEISCFSKWGITIPQLQTLTYTQNVESQHSGMRAFRIIYVASLKTNVVIPEYEYQEKGRHFKLFKILQNILYVKIQNIYMYKYI